MKIAIVNSERVRSSRRLDAGPYADPTARVDIEVATARRALATSQARLKNLLDKRQRLLEESP